MSLTILVHGERPVVIARWFLEPKGLVIYAGGPVVQIPLEEFRATGYEWIHQHFAEYAKTRVPVCKILPVFKLDEAEKLMMDRRVLQIRIDPQQNLVFSPMIVEEFSLGDLKRVKPLVEQRLALNSPTGNFWKIFDEALANSPVSK